MKLKTIKLSEIQRSYFVRTTINEAHALFLAELYESGVAVPPITVTADTLTLVDGRHRLTAMELALRKEAEVEIVPEMTSDELIAAAFTANLGGSLPPTRDDIEHTIELLMDQGKNRKEIVDLLSASAKNKAGIPASLMRTYVGKVQSNIFHRAMRRAVLAVVDGGLTVEQAAIKYAVDREKLRDEIRGKKKKSKEFGAREIKSGLSQKFKSNSQVVASLYRKLMDRYKDGEVNAEQIRDVADYIGTMVHRQVTNQKEWTRRIDSLLSGEAEEKSA